MPGLAPPITACNPLTITCNPLVGVPPAELARQYIPHLSVRRPSLLLSLTLWRESPLRYPAHRSHRDVLFAHPPDCCSLRFFASTTWRSSRLQHGSVLRASRRAVVKARHNGSFPRPVVSSLRLLNRVVGTLTDISGPHRRYLSYAGRTYGPLARVGVLRTPQDASASLRRLPPTTNFK